MPHQDASQLLNSLYALSDQSEQWPELVEKLLAVLADADIPACDHGDSLGHPVPHEQQLLDWLTPHVLRVLEMQRREHLNREREDFFVDVLDRNPVAMALCDTVGKVRWASQRLRSILDSMSSARVQEIVRDPAPRPSLHTVQTAAGAKLLMLVDVPVLGPHVCALLLQGESPIQLDPAQLEERYGLTRTEAAIANLLAQGLDPEDIARTNGTALATVRSQIKKILAKMGVTRQAEAVAALLSGTAHVHLGGVAKAPLEQRTHAVFAHQGVRLAYVVQGPTDGYPVFFLHSWAGSRLQAPRDATALFAQGFKLIAFDRPGMGASTAPEGYPPDLLPEAIRALALQMGHSRFSLLGYSLGALYAMRYAVALGDVVEHLFLVSPVAPLRGVRDLRGILPSGQLVLWLAMKAPLLVDPLMRLWMAHMRRTPTLYLDSVVPHMAAHDQRIMSSALAREEYVGSFQQAISQGDEGLLAELRQMTRPWSHHTQVTQDTHIWHGEDDTHVPLSNARRLYAEMPRCTLNPVKQSGHFLLFHHWPVILAGMAAARTPRLSSAVV